MMGFITNIAIIGFIFAIFWVHLFHFSFHTAISDLGWIK